MKKKLLSSFVCKKKLISKPMRPMGFSNFKIEGPGLGSAMVWEFLFYYMVKSKFHIVVREELYLDAMLDLF